MKFVNLLLIMCLIAVTCPARAATSAPGVQRLTLKKAITIALENNNLVRAAGFRYSAARQSVDIAGSHYYPDLFFEETLTASNAPTQTFMMKLDEGRFTQDDFRISNLNHPAAWHDFKTAVTVQQPLYTPMLYPALTMAEKNAEKELLGVDAARQDTAFRVFRLYLDVRKSGARIVAAEQAVKDAGENLRLTKVRGEAGVGLRSDELRARTHLSSVEQQRITALNDLALARLQLAMTLDMSVDTRIEAEESSTDLPGDVTLDALSALALENRSDLRQSRAELEKTEAAISLAGRAYLPIVGAFAAYQLNAKESPFRTDNDSWTAGVSLKWQLFDGFRSGHERGRATAERSAAAEMLKERTKEIRFQVQESLLRHEETGKRLEVARNALQYAEETVRLLSRRFENSLSTMVELLDAQTALNRARADLVDTEANYTLAGGWVYYAAGVFLKEFMK